MVEYPEDSGFEDLSDLYHTVLEGAFFWLAWETDEMDYFIIQHGGSGPVRSGNIHLLHGLPWSWMGVN